MVLQTKTRSSHGGKMCTFLCKFIPDKETQLIVTKGLEMYLYLAVYWHRYIENVLVIWTGGIPL